MNHFRTVDPDPLLAIPPTQLSDGRRRAAIQAAGALAFVLPLALVAYRNAVDPVTLRDLFVAPLLTGSAFIFWILFLHLIACGDDIDALGLRASRPGWDLALGIGLAAGMLVMQAGFGVVAARQFPPRPPAPQVYALIGAVSHSPWLLALWLGPVVWIGVALFEEFARVFLLRRIWLVRPDTGGRWSAILLVSGLVGLVHAYQGPGAVVSIALQSIPLGWVYFRTGRIRALIVAHALYDSTQIIMAVVAIRHMGS